MGSCYSALNCRQDCTKLQFQTLKLTKNGRRKSRKRFRKGKAEGRLQVCQGRTPVSRWEDPPSPEEPQFRRRSCWSHGCRLQLRHPGVPHRRGPRVGRKCLQGSQGQENHSQTLAARYPWRRGAGHPDQGNHRRGRRYPPHPQVSHREEGRGHQILDISKSIVSEGSRGGVLIEYGDIAILYSPPDSFLDYSCVFV